MGDRQLFDFLYHDAKRITSFLAQFSESGHVKEIKEDVERAFAEKTGSSREFGLDLKIVSAGGGRSDEGQSSEAEKFSKVFDPFWTNAIALQDILEERGVVASDLVDAGEGQFVKITGHLFVLDTRFFQKSYTDETFIKLLLPQATLNIDARIAQGDEMLRRHVESVGYEGIIRAENKLFGELEPQMQAFLLAESGMCWSILSPGNLMIPRDELLLRFGSSTQGSWTIFGVKDGNPTDDVNKELEILRKLCELTGKGNFVLETADLNFRMRSVMGRPFTSFSVTPLTIFRTIEVK